MTEPLWESREVAEAVIQDHDRSPRGFGRADEASHQAVGYSPLCGDRYTVSLRIAGGLIEEAAFEGFGCAISKASASIMTAQVTGLPVDAAKDRLEAFRLALNGETPSDLGELTYLMGVRDYPVRVKCALLPWRALAAAIDGQERVEVL